MAVSTELRPGSELLGYRIERVLGRGGMGVVYLAYQLVLDRMVALKLLIPELAEDERFRERFLRESKLAASLDHPNIVPVFDAGEVDGRLYIAMRYVEGSDLRRLLDDEPPDPARVVALLAPVADALDTAHARGLVHRDVKPSNILVDQAGRPYLADFGLTKTVEASGNVEQSHFAASLQYVAPEQIEQGPVGAAADRYSLACVLYEALTGVTPFRGDSRMSVLWGHLNDPPPPVTARDPELPAALDGVLASALSKDPADRHGTCSELVADVADALGLTGGRPRTSRRRRLVVGALAAAALAAAALAFGLVRDSPADPVLAPDSVVRLDPETGDVLAVVPAGRDPGAIAAGERWIWTVNASDGTVTQIDRSSGVVERTVRVTGTISADAPSVVAADGDVAWVVTGSGGKGFLTRVGDTGGAFPPTIELDVSDPVAVAVGEGAVWVAAKDVGRNVIVKVDAASGRVVGRTAVSPAETITEIAVGEGAVWFTDYGREETVSRLDPATLAVTGRLDTPGDDALAVAAGSVWLGNLETGVVARVDPRTLRVTGRAATGHRGAFSRVDLAVGGGAVWFASQEARQVVRIDARSLAVTRRIDLRPPGLAPGASQNVGPVGIVAGPDGAWVSVGH